MLISIIVPIYNVERYIEECIDSIVRQNVKEWELLLVDDGSTDSSGVICDEYSNRFDNIRVFHKKNGGVSSARNIGIAEAKGDWLVFVDGDDWLAEDYLDPIANWYSSKYNILHFGYTKQNREGEMIAIGGKVTGHFISDQLFCSENWSSVSVSYAFRKTLIDKYSIRFPEGFRISEDRAFIACAVVSAKEYFCVEGNGYYYRYTRGSAVNSHHPYACNRFNIEVAKYVENFVNRNGLAWGKDARRWFWGFQMHSHLLSVLRSKSFVSDLGAIQCDVNEFWRVVSAYQYDNDLFVEFWCMKYCLFPFLLYKKYIYPRVWHAKKLIMDFR